MRDDEIEISPRHFTGPPDTYADAVRISISPYGLVFEFGLMTGSPGDAKTQAIIRMSPQHALVMYQILKNNLRAYQDQVGAISLPDKLYEELGIEREV